jgi:ribonuclease HI
MMRNLATNQVAIFGMAETNFNWTPISNKICVNRAKAAIRRELGKRENVTLQASSCKGWHGGQYQPGGTCTGAIGHWASRIISREEDPEKLGRWSCLRVQIKGTVMSMITVYRVCKTNVNLESNTAYSQQWKELVTNTSKRIDPREKTLLDLKKYVGREIEEKREIIVMMDANESIDARTNEMNDLIQGCGLVDSHLLADIYAEVETYARGKGKIDYVLVTPRIQQCVRYTHIAPYNEWVVSDHRALILDIDYQVLEKGDLVIWQREDRGFTTGSARDRRKFVEECHKLGTRMNWNKRLSKIKKIQEPKEAEEKLNTLDKEVTQVLLSESKKLRRKIKPPKSSKLNEALLQHLMWRIALRGIKTKRCFRDRLNQIATKLKMRNDQEEWSQPRTVATNLRKTNKIRRKLEKEAYLLQTQEREANILSNLPTDRNRETARREVHHRMRQKAQFQQIKESVRGMRSAGVSHITIPDPYQAYPYEPSTIRNWKDEHDTQKVEEILLERNREHFRQAAGTPFTEEMLKMIPFTADSEVAEKVLSGEDIEGTTLEATQILKSCRRKVEEECEEINTEEIRNGFRRWDERTSTSPSGLHLGIYKSMTDMREQEEEKTYLLRTITGIINCAMSKGITLERWCRVHNVLLEKDPNHPKLHRLRIIHIIEADYNLATKIYWARRLQRTAEKKKLLCDSNWGSRKGRSAQDVAIVKELHYDITHLSLNEFATMENDAKSCYDRMIPSLIMLISRSFGLNKNVCRTVGKTFEKTRHKVATKNGISKDSFGYTKEEPIFGSWQGATKSVVSWVLTSSVLQEIHFQEAPGAHFKSTDGTIKVRQSTVGFVDDNNNCVTKNGEQPIQEALQKSAQKWERLLYSSGGTLELSKCFTYAINWEQDEEGRHKISEEPVSIKICESITNSSVEIKSKKATESHKTLGCFKNPAMSMRDQTRELHKRIERISQLMCSYGLSNETTRIAYHHVYLPAVQYALTSSYISRKALDAIQAKATRRFLSGMGYNPNMPRAVVYAPKQAGGMGLQRLYTTQGVRNVTQFLKHTRSDSTVGKLFKIGVDWLQRWAGISKAVMEEPAARIPPVTARYIESIREFLAKCNASIVMSKRPKVMREKDSFIMDHVMQSNMSSVEVNMVNKTRMYLQIELISEISNPEGTRIDQRWLKEGEKPSWSTLKWPQVKKPSAKMWKAWKKAINQIAQHGGELRVKLGRWKEIPKTRRYKWMQDGEYAYEEAENVIKKSKISEKSRRKAIMSNSHIIVEERSRECIPTNAPVGREIEVFGKAKIKNRRERQITEDIKIENPKSLEYLTKNLDIEEEERFAEIMTSEEIVTIVSDGGLKTDGGFGWVAAVDEEIIAKCHGAVRGSRDQLSSFRTEATGMFSAMRLMSSIAKQIRSQIKISAWTDNEALVKRITMMREFDSISANLRNDPDIYCGIRNAIKRLDVIEVGHVKGHQDETGQTLSTIEKLNVMADKLASKAVKEARCGEVEWHETLGPILTIDGKVITKNEGIKLCIAAEEDEFHAWQIEKLKLRPRTYQKIDWAAQHAVLAKLSRKSQRFAIRYVYHWLPAGKRLKMNNERELDVCPLCGSESEESSHFMKCKHRSMEKCFRDTIAKLRETLAANGAAHAASAKLLQNLTNWRRGTDDELKIGNGDINEIGFTNFMHGRIPKEMRRILPRGEESDDKVGRKMAESVIEAVLTGAEAAWRVRCDLAAAAGIAGVALGKKMRLAAKVHTLLREIKMTRVASLVEATAAQIMSRPDKEIESWVSRNENLLKRLKKDTAQRTLREYFAAANQNREGG